MDTARPLFGWMRSVFCFCGLRGCMPCHAGRDNARGVSYWHPAGFEPICRIIGYLADAIGRWDNAGRAGEGVVAGVFFVLGNFTFRLPGQRPSAYGTTLACHGDAPLQACFLVLGILPFPRMLGGGDDLLVEEVVDHQRRGLEGAADGIVIAHVRQAFGGGEGADLLVQRRPVAAIAAEVDGLVEGREGGVGARRCSREWSFCSRRAG